MQERHEVLGGFLETRKDTTIVFDFVEKAFDEMAFFIYMSVVGSRVRAVGAGWNDHLHAALLDERDQCIRIIPLIADNRVAGKCSKQPFCLPDIGRLPAGQDEGQGIAQGIGQGMNLGAKAASRTPQGFRFEAIHPEDKDRLIRHTFSLQRRALRAAHEEHDAG